MVCGSDKYSSKDMSDCWGASGEDSRGGDAIEGCRRCLQSGLGLNTQ